MEILVRLIGPETAWNGIAYYSFSSSEAEVVIGKEIEYFTQRGLKFEWKVYGHNSPQDLLLRLQRSGFRIGGTSGF